MKYIAILAGIAAGYPYLLTRRDRAGRKSGLFMLLLAVLFSVISTVSAMLFAVLENLIRGEDVHIGAISVYGVYTIAPFLLLLLFRVSGIKTAVGFDLFSVYAVISLFFMRINCIVSGCCLGLMIPGTGLRWPVRLAEMAFYLIMLIVLLRRERIMKYAGLGFPFLMLCYGVFRFIIEWFRESTSAGWLHLSHIWSLLAFIIGAGICLELSARYQKGKKRGSST